MTRETGAAHSTRLVDSLFANEKTTTTLLREKSTCCHMRQHGPEGVKTLKVWWHVKKYAACVSTPVGFLFYDVKEFN
jgi:hypothetical protein